MAVASLAPNYTSVDVILEARPDANSIDNVNTAVMRQLIFQCEAVMNSKLSRQYDVPIEEACPVLTMIATEMSIWKTLRIAYSQQTLKDDPIFQTHREARELLDMIADGKMDLITSSGDAVSRSTSNQRFYSINEGYEPTYQYGRSTLNQVVDPDLVDAVNTSAL